MAAGARWLGIPGALLVLTGVLSLGQGRGAREAGVAPEATVADAVAPADVAIAQDASGRRVTLPIGLLESNRLLLTFPQDLVGQKIELTLYRVRDGRREAEPWIVGHPTVRADACVPMLGVVAGTYDVTASLPGGSVLELTNVQAPGEATFWAATPPR